MKKEMKHFKEGNYYINLVSPTLKSVIGDEDFTDMINDLSKFSYLGVDGRGDVIRLVNLPPKGFMFVRYPLMDDRSIKLNDVLKEEKEMKKELTMEEKIEQLEREKMELELQIKNQKEYEKFRKSGDEVALAVKALQDSGFSRAEAMQILSIAGLQAAIPPFPIR